MSERDPAQTADERGPARGQRPAHEWEFFLSHAGADLEAARRLKRALDPPHRVFLDADNIRLGDDFDAALSEALRSSLITVVLVSPSTDAAFYQREEVAVAIQMVRDDPHTRRVVPVYLNQSKVPAHVQFGLKLKHGLCVPDPADLTEAQRRLRETLLAMQGFEERKVEVVEGQRAAVVKLTGGGRGADVLAGLGEVTRFVRPLLKTLLGMLVLIVALLVACLVLPQFADVRTLLAAVLGSLCALLLASVLWLTARSLSLAQQIALGHINGG